MEDDEWEIELEFEDVKKMFDPVVDKILDAVSEHLDVCNNNVSAMLLVGGFSESKYLQERAKQKFNRRFHNKIFFPERPAVAALEGGNFICIYIMYSIIIVITILIHHLLN
jgi:hypothetical protein